MDSEYEGVQEALRRIELCRRSGRPLLDLSALNLEWIPDTARDLTHVTILNLTDNRLTTLPPWLVSLNNVRTLVLWGNPLKEPPRQFSRLNLTALHLGYRNEPRFVAGALSGLKNLRVLSLYGIGLQAIPDVVRSLQALRALNLGNNDLELLPAWLADLPNLRTLEVNDNPRLELPAEITANPDAKRILDYYFRTRGDAALPLNEFKLTLVGRGGVGKTSLVHRLIRDDFKEFKRTPGIQITDWTVTVEGDDVRAHIWDFGGQEIMHGTHRFFMTERALYLVLISGREGTEDHDAEYWLSLVRSFAGDVPIIVLLHKSDDYPVELNRELLREKYGRNLVFLETDSKSGRGMTALREEICRQASALQGLKAAWPREWRRIKAELPANEKDWITFDDFRAFCRERGVRKRKIRRISPTACTPLV